ncbi:MAG: hypothetical protein ACFFDN_00895 [Candidatus Hodarchaeota archaeon]
MAAKPPFLDPNTPNWQVGAVITGSGQVPALNTPLPEYATYLANSNSVTPFVFSWKNSFTGKTGTFMVPPAQVIAIAVTEITTLHSGPTLAEMYWGATANSLINKTGYR